MNPTSVIAANLNPLFFRRCLLLSYLFFINVTFSFASAKKYIIAGDTSTVYRIRGKVLSNQKPVEFARFALKKAGMNKIISGGLTDTLGNYKLTIKDSGNYSLTVYNIGTDSISVPFSLALLKDIQLPDIILIQKRNDLSEVVITGKKAYIEHKIDRTTINVGASISNEGVNALEVLRKSPGVTVDANGEVSLRGRSGVLVLIDDKPTYLSSENLATYLKSLPSSLLDKIELMTNPPAKYDGQGGAGVINIKTKKTKVQGFNGSASLSYGQAIYSQTNANVNFNYRVNKVNLFANTGYNSQRSYRRLELQRTYLNESGDIMSVFNQTSYFRPLNRNPNLKMGMDYYLSPRTTLGIVLVGSISNSNDRSPVNSAVYNNKNVLDSTINSDNSTKSKFNNGGVNLNFSHELDTLGKILTFDLDYVKYNTNTDQNFLNNIYRSDSQASAQITSHLPSNISIYSVKSDYVHPLKGKAKLEGGIKSSYVNTDNEANYFNVINNISTINNDLTNRFQYKENINAAYLNFNKEFKRFSVQTGIRLENTNIKGHQLETEVRKDSLFRQNYFSLFPTAYFSYKLDSAGKNQLNFSFGRRIGRPNYQELNPFVKVIDKYTYFSGNPFLKPQYSYNYDLSYNYKGKFSVSLYYNYTKDIQKEIIQQNDNIFISTVGNIGEEKYFGLYTDLTLNSASWWESNIHGELMNIAYKGQINTVYVDQNKNYFNIRINNQFKLSDTWSAELSGSYISSMLRAGQIIAKPIWDVNAGVQKKVMKNKGSIRLSARDIFHSYLQDGTFINIPNVLSNYKNYMDTQVITIGFNYNFGIMKSKSRRNTAGAESEQNRVKN